MGKSKKTTVGYWYSMGLHMGVCAMPVDAFRRIVAGGRLAWYGNVTGSMDIRVSARNLWGGEKKEGGLEGTCSVCMGEQTQAPHPYLVAQLGTPMPAFRGLLTLVYRGIVGAMNPYLKAWSFQVSRWIVGWRTPVWEPTLAKVGDGMNGAHFAYRVITDPVTGLGRDPSKLDLDRMKQAAQTLYNEGLGLCLKWSRSDAVGNFMRIICDHVGGDFVDDPTTGKQYLKLYRGDYDITKVPLLDESNIVELVSYEQAALSGSVNRITVTYRDSATNKDASIVVSNPANIQAQGRVISEDANYPGAWNGDLATRFGMRDLQAKSSMPSRMKVKVHSTMVVRKGDVLAFSWASLNLTRMAIRVLEIDRGIPTDNAITLTCTQDVFSLPTQTFVVTQPPMWVEPDLAPKPISTARLLEASYRDLATMFRAADLAQIAPTASYVGSLGVRPNGLSYNYALTSRIGTSGTFNEVASGDFTPTGLLSADIAVNAGPCSITLVAPQGLDQVAVGSEALIDDELFRVTAIDAVAGTATLARGCVDTVPTLHTAGARVWFTDYFTAADPTEYIIGETIQAKLLTHTGAGALDPSAAATVSASLVARQSLPYPPGNLRIGGNRYPATVDGALVLAWSHRNRLLQADQLIDTQQTDVSPETGTTYVVSVYLNNKLDSTTKDITANTVTPKVSGDGTVRVEISAVRGGLTSLQKLSATFDYYTTQLRLTEAGDVLLDESGTARVLEA